MTSISKISCLCIVWLCLAPAFAAEPVKVGLADAVRNDVSSIGGTEIVRVNVGDDVMQNEVLQTKADSDAKIILLDSTNLTLGPQSTLKIDNAVYATDASFSNVSIKLTQGAFRFITGNSDKKSYRIETPTATIGIRGTILDIRIQPTKTLVTLQDGEAGVCVGARCVQLLQRGHTANITLNNGAVNLKRDLKPTWTFASVCAGNASLCAPLPPVIQRASIPGLPANTPSFGEALKATTAAGSVTKPLGRLATPSQTPVLATQPDRTVVDTGRIGVPSVSPSLPSVPAAPNPAGGLLRR